MSNSGSGNILLVDDNAINRYTIGRYLRRADYAVWEAANGEDALSLARQQPDLILLDVRMPDMLGDDVCRILRGNPVTAAIPIIHISATFRSASHRAEGLQHGADAYLTEPVDPDELLANVKVLLRKAVERMNGTVGVEPEANQGSRFWVELPQVTPEP